MSAPRLERPADLCGLPLRGREHTCLRSLAHHIGAASRRTTVRILVAVDKAPRRPEDRDPMSTFDARL